MFSMTLFIVTVILIFVVCSHQLEHPPADVNSQRRQICIEQTSVDPELVSKFSHGEIIEDEKLECYFKCRFILSDRMNENGELSPTAFSTTVPIYVDLTKADEIVAKCKDLKGNDPCNNAFVVVKCMKEASM